MTKYQILKESFGYETFRRGQEEVIDALLERRDVLALMPTGAGKSICYQIPALLLDGLTVVISPLISLMKDQTRALSEAGISSAFINSSLDTRQYFDTIRRASAGEYRILYAAPERLLRDDINRIADSFSVAMLVIDEAHCISQWGHDFRPSYIQIAPFIHSLKRRPVVAAFTATATEKVKNDIGAMLELRNPFFISTGFDRPNLYFETRQGDNKNKALIEILNKRKDKSGQLRSGGIIYCSTRNAVEEVAEMLADSGFNATRYHAGLDDKERHDNQDDFIYDRKPIMVATNAFGMGIDKSNVSFVIHYNMPKNIESYYQEAGRAGRDGETADCILLYNGKDVHTNEYLIKHSVDENIENAAEIIAHKLELLRLMTFYSTTTDCLRERLLAYFGESLGTVKTSYCGNCSNCRTHFEKTDITIEAQKIVSCVYRLNQRGKRFGSAVVSEILKGSKAEKILNARLDTLSTYGIMAGDNIRRIRDITDYLVNNGFLGVNTDEYNVLYLTEKSKEIVVEKKSLSIMLPKEKQPEVQKDVFAGSDENLLALLKSLRLEFARNTKLPAYMIFTDASLHEMCRKLPVSKQAFLGIQGVGSLKAEKYGEAFIGVIKNYTTPDAGASAL
jgi:ATP-dependent DNA helicase RecQ